MFLVFNGEKYLDKHGRFNDINKARIFAKEHHTFDAIRKFSQRYPNLMVCRCELVELDKYSVADKIKASDDRKQQRILECKKKNTESIIKHLKLELEKYENQLG